MNHQRDWAPTIRMVCIDPDRNRIRAQLWAFYAPDAASGSPVVCRFAATIEAWRLSRIQAPVMLQGGNRDGASRRNELTPGCTLFLYQAKVTSTQARQTVAYDVLAFVNRR